MTCLRQFFLVAGKRASIEWRASASDASQVDDLFWQLSKKMSVTVGPDQDLCPIVNGQVVGHVGHVSVNDGRRNGAPVQRRFQNGVARMKRRLSKHDVVNVDG